MKLLLFGASGMVGQAVLRQALLDPAVTAIRTVGRAAVPAQHPRLTQCILPNLLDYSPAEPELTGFDACIFALGISSVGTPADVYTRVTYDIPIAAATTLARLNPAMIFVHMSAAGADSTERSRQAWARVKGRTENALLRLPFRAVHIFRPGFIQPLHGIRSRTLAYNIIYILTAPLTPLLLRLLPTHVLTTDILARALLAAARQAAPTPILTPAAILALSGT